MYIYKTLVKQIDEVVVKYAKNRCRVSGSQVLVVADQC